MPRDGVTQTRTFVYDDYHAEQTDVVYEPRERYGELCLQPKLCTQNIHRALIEALRGSGRSLLFQVAF